MAEIKPGGEKNAVADVPAKDDLITALVKFADAGEVLAERCRDAGCLYIAVGLSRQMKALHAEVAHEVSKAKA
jgi:hypothetical protein